MLVHLVLLRFHPSESARQAIRMDHPILLEAAISDTLGAQNDGGVHFNIGQFNGTSIAAGNHSSTRRMSV
jgi:hypothetical protein